MSKNPGAPQVLSKGSKQPLGGSGSGKATPTTKQSLPNPADGKYSPKAVRSQQLQPGRIGKVSITADYAGDGKSYGASGNKTLRDPSKSSAFRLNSPGRGR